MRIDFINIQFALRCHILIERYLKDFLISFVLFQIRPKCFSKMISGSYLSLDVGEGCFCVGQVLVIK